MLRVEVLKIVSLKLRVPLSQFFKKQIMNNITHNGLCLILMNHSIITVIITPNVGFGCAGSNATPSKGTTPLAMICCLTLSLEYSYFHNYACC